MNIKLLYSLFLITSIVSNLFSQTPAFPGAEGFGANTTGGRGGQVIYVTNLNDNGPGSLTEALSTPGPRYILFKVSGVINSYVETIYGDYTLAGQTSPNGITVRGFLVDEVYDTAGTGNNIIVRHIRSRPHDAEIIAGDPLDDALRLDGASNVIIDHCSFANAIDESVQISQSSHITIQNSMFSETIGEHFYLGGMLFNYSTPEHPQDSISIHHNTWNRMGGRLPELSCESAYGKERPLHLELSNNLIWDQQINIWYNSNIDQTAQVPIDSFFIHLNWVNNYSVGRSTFTNGMIAHNLLEIADNRIYANGNKMNLFPSYSDYDLFYCCNDFNQSGNNPNTDMGVATILSARHTFPTISYTNSDSVVSYMYKNVGAFPRDSMDRRLTAPFPSGIPYSEPIDSADHFNDAFVLSGNAIAETDADSDGMPDYWETAHGLNPNQQDHNGTNLSVQTTGITGYTNLECYLNCLADALVNGNSTAQCGIIAGISENKLNNNDNFQLQNIPNPLADKTTITFSINKTEPVTVSILNSVGQTISTIVNQTLQAGKHTIEFNATELSAGIYFYQLQTPSANITKQMIVTKH